MTELCSKCLFVRCIWLFVCSFHVTYAFQSASTLYSCLNVKELFAQSRLEIWSLSDCNWTRTQNHLVPWHSGDYRVWIHCETLRDMTRTYSQMHRTNNYSEQSSIIWPVWTNGWVFFYELNGLNVRLQTKWFWVRLQLQALKLQILRLLRARSSFTFR